MLNGVPQEMQKQRLLMYYDALQLFFLLPYYKRHTMRHTQYNIFGGSLEIHMRLNARIDDQSAYKIEFLKEATQDSLTDIIKKALDLYYDQFTMNKQSPLEIMKKNGFIGCAPGPCDLSENYKEYLTKSLNEKNDHR